MVLFFSCGNLSWELIEVVFVERFRFVRHSVSRKGRGGGLQTVSLFGWNLGSQICNYYACALKLWWHPRRAALPPVQTAVTLLKRAASLNPPLVFTDAMGKSSVWINRYKSVSCLFLSTGCMSDSFGAQCWSLALRLAGLAGLSSHWCHQQWAGKWVNNNNE